MADFRIDRIRFRWRGDWSAGTLYVKDDVLRFGAKVYVCVEVHTSDSNFYNDLNATIPRWTQMMIGTQVSMSRVVVESQRSVA